MRPTVPAVLLLVSVLPLGRAEAQLERDRFFPPVSPQEILRARPEIEEWIEVLSDVDGPTRHDAIVELRRLGRPILPLVAPGIGRGGDPIRARATWMLLADLADPAALPVMRTALDDETREDVLPVACLAAATFDDGSLVERIRDVVVSDRGKPLVRQCAGLALARIAPERAADLLAKGLRGEGAVRVAETWILALATLGASSADEVVRARAAADAEELWLAAALHARARRRSEPAARGEKPSHPLPTDPRKGLVHRDPLARAFSILALAEAAIGSADEDHAREALATCTLQLEDDEPIVRRAAMTAMGALASRTNPKGPRREKAVLRAMADESDPSALASALLATARFGIAIDANLYHRALRHDDPRVREAAVLAWAAASREIGSGVDPGSVVPVLLERLVDDDASVRRAALMALVCLPPAAWPAAEAFDALPESDRNGPRGTFDALRAGRVDPATFLDERDHRVRRLGGSVEALLDALPGLAIAASLGLASDPTMRVGPDGKLAGTGRGTAATERIQARRSQSDLGPFRVVTRAGSVEEDLRLWWIRRPDVLAADRR